MINLTSIQEQFDEEFTSALDPEKFDEDSRFIPVAPIKGFEEWRTVNLVPAKPIKSFYATQINLLLDEVEKIVFPFVINEDDTDWKMLKSQLNELRK